jgi:hypothetical protein
MHIPGREVMYGKVRPVGVEASGVGDASSKKGHAQKRIGPQGEEPEAGDCDRFE